MGQLSNSNFGCRVVQKLLEVASVEQQQEIVRILRSEYCVAVLIEHPNAHHVIQKVVQVLPVEQLGFVLECFHGQARQLSKHKFASRVLLRIIETTSHSQLQRLVDEVLPHSAELARDQYGNFVVQHVLQHGLDADRSTIVKALGGHFTQMSMEKFASNTVEKCLKLATPAERESIISEILEGESFTMGSALGDGEEAQALRTVAVSPLVAIMVHPYGNYVVQRMLEYGNDEQKQLITARVNEFGPTALQSGKFSKHTLNAVSGGCQPALEVLCSG